MAPANKDCYYSWQSRRVDVRSHRNGAGQRRSRSWASKYLPQQQVLLMPLKVVRVQPDGMALICNPSTWEGEKVGGSGIER